MKINYEATIGGSIEIDEEEVKKIPVDKREDYINDAVSAAASEDLDSSLYWEIDEDES